jgi:hypothetical protein
MKGCFLDAMGLLFKPGPGRHVSSQANDGLDAFLHNFGIELNGAKKIAIVGHGERWEPEFLGAGHELLNLTGRVEKTVFCVAVEVDEVAVAHLKSVERMEESGWRKTGLPAIRHPSSAILDYSHSIVAGGLLEIS